MVSVGRQGVTKGSRSMEMCVWGIYFVSGERSSLSTSRLPFFELLCSDMTFHHNVLPRTMQSADHRLNFRNCEPNKLLLYIVLVRYFHHSHKNLTETI